MTYAQYLRARTCQCDQPSGSYCRIHDRESAIPTAADNARLRQELSRWDELYRQAYVLGYCGRRLPPVLEQTRPDVVQAWLSGVDWVRRDASFYRSKLRRWRRR